ncbi:hypothetical protein [Pandoraea fibrosis]|uniref:WipA-like phosphatase domain-containing protein n=1 Tax=Pandoraea fibrosis TaxID=1891094 RepID=A0A5E4YDM7_9BURK|nr:hypothetical protein [Pandoraea fibrosis]VVE46876.1 hypothetical protein PFI31113_04428 [Pandoraea fibrosis]
MTVSWSATKPTQKSAVNALSIGESRRTKSIEAATQFLGKVVDKCQEKNLSPVPEFFRLLGNDASKRHEAFAGIHHVTSSRLDEPMLGMTDKSKILTLMAVLHDPRCINPNNGEIRPDRTASVISSLGAPHGIDLSDVTVMPGIYFNGDTDAIEFPGDPPVKLEGLQQRIADARTAAKARQPMPVATDLNAMVPTRSPTLGKLQELSLGDMHGNVKLLLFQLVNTGVLEIKNEAAWVDCMKALQGASKHTPFGPSQTTTGKLNAQAQGSLTANALDFQELLGRAVKPGDNGDAKLVLLGDLLNDRGHNDFCMLSAFAALNHCGVAFTVIASNHDTEFLRFFDQAKLLPPEASWRSKLDEMLGARQDGVSASGTSRGEYDSLKSLVAMMDYVGPGGIEERALLRDTVTHMVETHYRTHFKLIEQSCDQSAYYSHGPGVNPVYQSLSRNAGITDDSLCFGESVAIINKSCLSEAFESEEGFNKTFLPQHTHDDMLGSKFDPDTVAATALVWGHGVKNNGPLFAELSDDFALADDFQRNIHGHTPLGPDAWRYQDALADGAIDLANTIAKNDREGLQAFVSAADKVDGKPMVDALGLLTNMLLEAGKIVEGSGEGAAVIAYLTDQMGIAVPDNVKEFLLKDDQAVEDMARTFSGEVEPAKITPLARDIERAGLGGTSFEFKRAVNRLLGFAAKIGLVKPRTNADAQTAPSAQFRNVGVTLGDRVAAEMDATPTPLSVGDRIATALTSMLDQLSRIGEARAAVKNHENAEFYNSLDGNKGKPMLDRFKVPILDPDTGYFAYEKVAREREVFAIPAGFDLVDYK